MKRLLSIMLGLGIGVLLSSNALADTIDPVSFADTLDIGESVTIRKTVTVSDTPSSTGRLDVMFIFDVTGSMGGEIAAAKSKAAEILTSLGTFGDRATGTGWYSDTDAGPAGSPGFDGVHTDLSTSDAVTSAGIDDMWDTGSCRVAGTFVGCGGDFAELGYAAIKDAADTASWRPGSARFIIALGDASFKTPPSSAATIASLNAAGVTYLGVSFSPAFTASSTPLATATGGSVFAASADGDSIAAAITAGITSSFDEYTEVTVDDLGAAAPGVGVSVVCVSADTGSCSGATAGGTYDRSIVRSFDFDVTFTGLTAGTHTFDTHALVDGAIVASEADTITVGGDPIPEPASMTLIIVGMGLLGVGRFHRRSRS